MGSTRKLVKKLLIVYVYYQLNSCNTHTECELAGGTFLRQHEKVSPAHTQRMYLEERSEGSPPELMYPSICPSGIPKHVDFQVGMKIRVSYPHGVFCPSSIPSEYLFLCARRKFGFNKKIRINLPIVHSLRVGWRNSFSVLRFLQPTRSECTQQWICDVPLRQFFSCSRKKFSVLLTNLQ